MPEGGLIAAVLVYFGNRICADPGYAGTTGALSITVIIYLTSFIGFKPEFFIVGMVLAILTIQGLYQTGASRLLGKLAKKMGRYAKIS
jgi:energy-converting hydrogenase A subunit B